MTRILIVDDSAVSRKRLRTILEAAGFTVAGEACDGAEGFEQYKALLPDIATLDITMPNVNGITLLKQIKEQYPEARVIMITALGNSGKILEALDAGASNYITKPFEDGQIIATIREVLNSRLM